MDAEILRASEVPPLFTRVPAGLFGPLTGTFAPLYWTILSVYYHYEFEREPFFLLKSVVLDTAEETVPRLDTFLAKAERFSHELRCYEHTRGFGREIGDARRRADCLAEAFPRGIKSAAQFGAPSFYRIVNCDRIVNYDTVPRDLDLIRSWSPDLVVLDEAQRIKNWQTRTARSVKRIASPYAIVLTGTPIENRSRPPRRRPRALPLRLPAPEVIGEALRAVRTLLPAPGG